MDFNKDYSGLSDRIKFDKIIEKTKQRELTVQERSFIHAYAEDLASK